MSEHFAPPVVAPLRVHLATLRHHRLIASAASMSDVDFMAAMELYTHHPSRHVRWTLAHRWTRIRFPDQSPFDHVEDAMHFWLPDTVRDWD